MIAARDLRVRRGGREVLHGLTFELAGGQIAGLIGPSGGGKTTLMRVVVGVQRGVSGVVRVLGENAGDPSLRRHVGYGTQAQSVYEDLTVRENLEYFATVVGARAEQVGEVIEQVDLGETVGRLARSLSGGQRSRLSLAAALLGRPELLVLDEPTIGLDPVLRERLWGLFRDLADGGMSLLVSSHVMEEAARCDEVLLVREGQVMAQGTPAELTGRTGAKDLDQAFLRLVGEQQ